MLGKLFGGKAKAAAQAPAPTLSSGLRSTIFNVIGSNAIPTMPSAAQKAFQLATDPNAEARDFVEVIESDESLSGRVIKIANSVYFDRGKKNETIEDCVTVIGINELRCLLNATSLAQLVPSKHQARPQLWSNDIATAIFARQLALRSMPQKEGLAFLAGLMHDIGKLLLLQRIPEEYGMVLQAVQSRGKSFIEAENDQLAFNHCEVGVLIAEKWNFSPELTDAIRFHHTPFPSPVNRSLTYIVKAADTIAHALGIGHQQGFAALRNRAAEELAEVWSYLGIPSADAKQELQNFQRAFELEKDLYSSQRTEH